MNTIPRHQGNFRHFFENYKSIPNFGLLFPVKKWTGLYFGPFFQKKPSGHPGSELQTAARLITMSQQEKCENQYKKYQYKKSTRGYFLRKKALNRSTINASRCIVFNVFPDSSP
jgi:hypothetical protein